MHFNEPSFVSIEGRRIAYTAISPPDPKGTILLLPGAESNQLIWYKQLGVFGHAFRTIALDYRDTGDSDPVAESYTIADLADDAAGVLAALAVSRAYLVGISLGGYVALLLALRHPERVAKLVLVSTSAAYIPPSARVPDVQELLAQLPIQQHARAIPNGEDGEDRQGGKDLPYGNEIIQRLLTMVFAVTAPGYFASHPDDWKWVAEWARYRPMRPEAGTRQL